MTAMGWVQIALYCVLLVGVTAPLGAYMTRVFQGERTFLSFILSPLERAIYRLCGVDEKEEQHWTTYGIAMLAFSIAGFVLFYVIQRLQGVLPLNPQHLPAVGEHLAFNTAVSFVTNTNWQSYAGESTLSHLTQMTGLTVQQFVSAAAGMAVMAALIRGLSRAGQRTIGNFWVDLVRTTIRILVPIAFVFSGTIFVAAGDRMHAIPVSWDKEARFRLPVPTWRALMAQYFGDTAWIRLRRDSFDALCRFRAKSALPSWEATVDALCAAATEREPI